jgi:hypothetical protein
MPMLTVHGSVEQRRLGELVAVRAHATIEDIVRWGMTQQPAATIADIVKQDEFTLDIVVPCAGGAYLVYDTT